MFSAILTRPSEQSGSLRTFSSAAFLQGRLMVRKLSRLNRRYLKTVAIILIFFQFLDGALTAVGLHTFGLEAEGNPVLAHFMKEFGLVMPLVFAKALASFAVVLLYLARNIVTWVPLALTSLTCFYYFAAIIPWSLTLYLAR